MMAVLSINMLKILFPKTTMAELVNYKNKKKVYAHKDKQKPCRFFVVPGGVPALLGMPDVKTL